MPNKLRSKQDLEARQKELINERQSGKSLISICNRTACHPYGCAQIIEAFKREISQQGLDNKTELRITGCHGLCEKGPIVVIQPGDIFYQQVKLEDIHEILHEQISKGNIIDRLLHADPISGKKIVHRNEIPFYQNQKRSILGNTTKINPVKIDDYIAI